MNIILCLKYNKLICINYFKKKMGLFHKKIDRLPTIKEESQKIEDEENIMMDELNNELHDANEQIMKLYDEILQIKAKNLRLELENYNLDIELRNAQDDLEICNINYFNEVNENKELKVELEIYKKENLILKEINDMYEEYTKELSNDIQTTLSDDKPSE